MSFLSSYFHRKGEGFCVVVTPSQCSLSRQSTENESMRTFRPVPQPLFCFVCFLEVFISPRFCPVQMFAGLVDHLRPKFLAFLSLPLSALLSTRPEARPKSPLHGTLRSYDAPKYISGRMQKRHISNYSSREKLRIPSSQLNCFPPTGCHPSEWATGHLSIILLYCAPPTPPPPTRPARPFGGFLMPTLMLLEFGRTRPDTPRQNSRSRNTQTIYHSEFF